MACDDCQKTAAELAALKRVLRDGLLQVVRHLEKGEQVKPGRQSAGYDGVCQQPAKRDLQAYPPPDWKPKDFHITPIL